MAERDRQRLTGALADVGAEVHRAWAKWPAFNSVHEGYAVILEELDELWEEAKKKEPDKAKLRTEAKQVAAMAIRFMVELTDG